MYRHDDFRLLAIHLTSHRRPPCFKRLIIDRQGITAAMTSLAPCRLSRSLRPWVGEVGKPAAVLLLFEESLSDRKRVLGPDHPDTLDTRHNIAAWIGRVGKPGEAMRLSEESLPDQQRVLGSDHPDTLDTRQQIAILRKELGDSG